MRRTTLIGRVVRWHSRLAVREAVEGYLCTFPWVIGYVIFMAGPIVYTFWLSLTSYDVFSPPRFIGLGNFEAIAADPLFWQSLRITALYTAVVVPLQIILGYSLALLLNERVAGLSLWRTLCYMPSIVPMLGSAYIFLYMFEADIGLINTALRYIGVEGPTWFGSPTWVLPAFMVMGLWGAGGGLILYLSALQGVPTALYDAAKVDGASAWGRFWNVTIPMTSPVIFFTFLTGIIGTFQVFGSSYIMTNGGPANASLFYVLYLYKNGWQYLDMGYAAGLALVLFIILVSLTALTLRVSGRLVYYETG